MSHQTQHTRRRVLATLTTAAAAASVPVTLRAAQRVLTPRQTAGPFYPLELPLDSDNDLVIVAGRPGIAKGEVINVVGRVVDRDGRSIQNARVEIWQCDANRRYRHPWDRGGAAPDENFQGYGAFTTGPDGGYRFRTIKPVPYPGRAPHIHFAIESPGGGRLVTQMYVAGEPDNDYDGVLNRIRDARTRASVVVALEHRPESVDERVGQFDIVLENRLSVFPPETESIA